MMKKRMLAMMLAMIMLAGVVALPAETAQAASTTAVVKGGWLRLRSLPNFDAKTLASYYTGTVVSVLGTVGEWYHVTAPDGHSGYMYGRYLNVGGYPGGSGGNLNIPARVVSANGLGVRLRSGPGTAYGVLGLYPVGTSATILSTGSNWYYVRIGSHKGYMMSQFLSTGESPVTPPSSGGYVAYVTSSNGLGVRLRKGPGTGYGVYGLYSVGTKVSVLNHGATWDYVRIGSRTGYMMNKYLTTSYTPPSSGKEITSVSLNTSSPVPGTTLYASIRPSGATVYYEWLDDDGVLLSSASTYNVKSSDVGKQIRVRVTGTGHYTGTAGSGWATVKSSGSDPADSKVTLTGVSLSNLSPSIGESVRATARPAGATANYVWYRDDGTNLGSGSTYTVKASDAGHAIYCAAYATGDFTGNVASYYTAKIPQPEEEDKQFTGMVMIPASAGKGVTLAAGVSVNCSDYSITWYAGSLNCGSGNQLTVTEAMEGLNVTCVVRANAGSGYTGSVTSNICYITPGDAG